MPTSTTGLPIFVIPDNIVTIMSITESIPYLQIVLSVLLIGAILLQRSEAAVGGAFGGGDSFSSGYHTKRGPEKAIFIATIIIAVIFVATSFSLLLI